LPNPPEIRAAELADAPPIARLVNDAFRPERFFSTTDRTDLDKVAALMQTGKFFMLFEDGVLAGCIYTELRGERGYFGLLAVDPQRQRSGTGARLIDAAEKYCRSAQCRFMDLTFVNVRQELPPYYRRFGYIESGTLPFPPDQATRIPVHLVRMSKPL
jgi:N-acetylglutamate synthase-like GNAT family acetyltransferase